MRGATTAAHRRVRGEGGREGVGKGDKGGVAVRIRDGKDRGSLNSSFRSRGL